MTTTNYVRCPGCGVKFKGERGLRAHQSQKHLTMACRPNDETRLNDALDAIVWTEAPLAEPDPRVDYDSIHFRRKEGRLTDG